MKIQIFSDIHLEFGRSMPELDYHIEIPDMEADLVVAAGDIGTGTMGATWLRNRFPKSQVVYVMGNHEYYGGRIPGAKEKIMRCLKMHNNIHVLDDEILTIKDWKLFACTLWTDFNLNGNPEQAMSHSRSIMNDYRSIEYEDRKLEPLDTMTLHYRSRKKIESFLQENDPSQSIIITHHSPCYQSIEGSRINAIERSSYTSDMIRLIEEYQPAYWIHGHIHRTMEYNVGKTKIIQNGLGYPETSSPACNPDFDPECVIEV